MLRHDHAVGPGRERELGGPVEQGVAHRAARRTELPAKATRQVWTSICSSL
jgi:hypothetical protein